MCLIKLRGTHTNLYGYRYNVCIYQHDGLTYTCKFLFICCNVYSTLMND